MTRTNALRKEVAEEIGIRSAKVRAGVLGGEVRAGLAAWLERLLLSGVPWHLEQNAVIEASEHVLEVEVELVCFECVLRTGIWHLTECSLTETVILLP